MERRREAKDGEVRVRSLLLCRVQLTGSVGKLGTQRHTECIFIALWSQISGMIFFHGGKLCQVLGKRLLWLAVQTLLIQVWKAPALISALRHGSPCLDPEHRHCPSTFSLLTRWGLLLSLLPALGAQQEGACSYSLLLVAQLTCSVLFFSDLCALSPKTSFPSSRSAPRALH